MWTEIKQICRMQIKLIKHQTLFPLLMRQINFTSQKTFIFVFCFIYKPCLRDNRDNVIQASIKYSQKQLPRFKERSKRTVCKLDKGITHNCRTWEVVVRFRWRFDCMAPKKIQEMLSLCVISKKTRNCVWWRLL